MKLLLFLLILITPAVTWATTDYELELNLHPAEHKLTATAHINFNGQPATPLELSLSPSCEIIEVHQGATPLPFQFSGGTLRLEPLGAQPLSINYRGVFNDQVSENPLHNEDPSYGVSATITARGIYLSSGTNWYPQLAGGDVRYRISITAPAGIEALTSGQRISRQTGSSLSHSAWLIDYPIRGLTLSAGAYEVFEDLSGAVPIYAYFHTDSAPLAAAYLQESRNYLKLYTELFGPYPFHKFAIVENFFPTGYGLPSWTLLGSSVIKLPFIVKTSLGHEIAHSWWGIGVQVDAAKGNWSEGLTTYVADYLYKERSSEAEAREYRQNILRDYANLVDTNNAFAINRFSSRYDKTSQAIGYGKTAMVFHMLRQKVGDKIFWTGLRMLAKEKLHAQIGWTDFADLFSTLSGQQLQPFFTQWLTRADGPQLALQDVAQVQTGYGWRVSGQLAQQTAYQLDVVLQLTTDAEVLRQTIRLDAASQAFSFETSGRPLVLEGDPKVDLFRILTQQELPATVNSIRGSDNLLMLRAEKYAPDNEATKTLLNAMRKADLEIQALSEVSQAELADHDLLIFGLADQLRPQQLHMLREDQFTIEEQPVNPTEQSAFIVEKNPLNPAKSAAWFISADQQANVVARKIPHYGKYSYLLFDGVNNRLKGIHRPKMSPLRVKLN